MTFQSLGLPDKVVQALQSAGFQQPAAVQVMSPPSLQSASEAPVLALSSAFVMLGYCMPYQDLEQHCVLC